MKINEKKKQKENRQKSTLSKVFVLSCRILIIKKG